MFFKANTFSHILREPRLH